MGKLLKVTTKLYYFPHRAKSNFVTFGPPQSFLYIKNHIYIFIIQKNKEKYKT